MAKERLLRSNSLNWQKTLFLVVAVSGFCYFLLPILGYRSIGFIFLLLILFVGTFGKINSIILATISSALIWDFFFILPRMTFYISAPEDIFMIFSFFIVALITGLFTYKIKSNETLIRDREDYTKTLYEVLKDITSGQENSEFLKKIADRVGKLFDGHCAIITKSTDNILQFNNLDTYSMSLNEKDKSIIDWSFKNNQKAGWSADTLNHSRSLFIPITGETESVGVFIFKPNDRENILGQDREKLLYAIIHQLGISIEINFLAKKLAEAKRMRDSELLHQTILNSISHEIKTPLTAINGSTTALENEAIYNDTNYMKSIISNLRDASDRLSQVVENLLDMSRINSGTLKLNLEWHDMGDLVGVVMRKTSKALVQHEIKIENNHALPLLKFDFRLMEHAISNLLLNAAIYSQKDKNIKIAIRQIEDHFFLLIEDQGPGIPENYVEKIFDKFFRVPGSPTGGTGLGLSIAKDIIELHQGKIEVENIEPHGARFTIKLPIEEQPKIHTEELNGEKF